jgi:hypothetical protein
LHCNDPNCAGGDESITIPDFIGAVGSHTSIALDANGYPVVSYRDVSNEALKVLHCNDPDCEGGDDTITTVDSTGNTGWYISMALDSNGYPVVSYYRLDTGNLKILHCNDANCAGNNESITNPDGPEDVGIDSDLVLDANGYPVVAYSDSTNTGLKILHCNDANCAGGNESITSPDTDGSVGFWPSLALDANGYPIVSYYDGTNQKLKLMHCNDADCAGGDESITVPIQNELGGAYSSLALDGNGNPIVSYVGSASPAAELDLKVLRCDDPNCEGQESITTPDSNGDVGYDSSLVLDDEGRPVVSYMRYDTDNLKLLHCTYAHCGPNAAPVAGAGGPYAVNEGGAVQLDASATTDTEQAPDTLDYAWDFDGDGQYDDAAGVSPTFSAATIDGPDSITVAVRVTDDDSKVDVAQSTVTVNNAVPVITVVSDDGPVLIDEDITITVSANDPAGILDPLAYAFDCDNDGGYDVAAQPEPSATCNYDEAGDHIVGVRVTDGDGGEALISTVVQVQEEPVEVDFPLYVPTLFGSE